MIRVQCFLLNMPLVPFKTGCGLHSPSGLHEVKKTTSQNTCCLFGSQNEKERVYFELCKQISYEELQFNSVTETVFNINMKTTFKIVISK